MTFPQEGQTVAMLDAGDATYVELFSGRSGEKPSGSILHLALRTGDCDEATERARAAGGTITQEPKDVVLEGDPPVPVRFSFCEGPDGEQIELFQADVLWGAVHVSRKLAAGLARRRLSRKPSGRWA